MIFFQNVWFEMANILKKFLKSWFNLVRFWKQKREKVSHFQFFFVICRKSSYISKKLYFD
jgi:hypothetical protein